MTPFDAIREATATYIDDDVRDVCLRLIDEIEKRKNSSGKSLWTYRVFASWMTPSAPDEVIQECVNFLASTKKARLLDVHFIAFDPLEPDDIGTFIDEEEVANAYRTGVLYHPTTGLKVKDFEQWLVPYFTLSEGSGRTIS